MARSAIDTDPFLALASPQRREIIQLLAPGTRSVTEIAQALAITQPHASKQLKVLKDAGMVAVQVAGPQRLYRLNREALMPVQAWLQQLERDWHERFDRLDTLLEALEKEDPS